MIIYKATNKVNGKCYIGQTIQGLRKRINQHHHQSKKNKSNSYFHRVLKKSPNDFVWEIINSECNTREELDEMEYHYIKQYHSHVSEGGYNIKEGGEQGGVGYKHTNKTKQKLSKWMIEYRKLHPQDGNNNNMYGKKHTDETKRKISKQQKGKQRWNNIPHPNLKKWKVIHPDGKEEIIIGLSKFCRQHKLDYNTMLRVSKGDQKKGHHKGYSCKKYYSI